MRTQGWKGAVLVASLTLGGSAVAQSSAASTSGGSTTGSSTSGDSTTGDTSKSGSSTSSGQGAGKLDKSLTQAVQKLHAANQGEVQAAQFATQSAQSPEVKTFAQRMTEDHQKNDDRLQQLAQGMGVTLQGDEFQKKQQQAQSDMQKLQGKTGAEFDKAYMKMMIDEHKKDVKEVDKAAKDARKQKQTQLASFLDQTHSHMQMHLQEAERIEKSLGKGGASAQGSPSSSGMQGTGSSRSSGSGTSSGSSDASSGSSGSSGSSSGSTGGSSDTSGASGSPGSTGGSTGGSNTGSRGTSSDTAGTTGSGSSGSGSGSSGTSGSSSGGTRTP